MYDIKRLEAGQQQHQQLRLRGSTTAQPQLTCSVITPPQLTHNCNISLQHPHSLGTTSGGKQALSHYRDPTEATHMTLISLRRRRLFQRRACLLSILAAFVFGMALGVVVPMFGLPDYFNSSDSSGSTGDQPLPALTLAPYSVAFIKDEETELTAEQVFRNVFHLEQDKNAPDSMIVKKLDTSDGSIKEFHVQRTANGRYRKGPERRLSKPAVGKQALSDQSADGRLATGNAWPLARPNVESTQSRHRNEGIIKSDIFWGDLVESALPKGFGSPDQLSWERYVAGEGEVMRLEHGCGRMQNRMVVFADGTRACARYRQNTDQIQGEIFSYYLGQLLNISNLAPSAATIIDTTTSSWSAAVGDITQAQWKEKRPVVLTRWLPDLEPAGIPQPFQPLERHLNKYDVWNITLQRLQQQQQHATQQRGLLKRLEAASNPTYTHQSRMLDSAASSTASEAAEQAVLQRLIELAQWSDLIVFDYLIANLDRVVNNLYNFQWNADIMAAPAHNLARQTHSHLLVFLDNESGLLHGYRLLKKYEAYHSLLLDNLCVFRQPTIEALQRLRAEGAGRRLRELFERTTSANVRDVLPSLPDKSIKILVERIDRVLGQVQKCRDMLAADNNNSAITTKRPVKNMATTLTTRTDRPIDNTERGTQMSTPAPVVER
ncbi:extracellular serine/threonine protein kinase four-jointed [Scaptodrosophila lebanonensis]|uniref:Extracellular serine/threonine protein kinase four-jointed n=1 Tax=Drosophila lebanonensis TaxID=7225 RepID=A0A6J2TXQ5_DROLE|nr:extracellular serine/threonine protein kinase four-jointed [Scaptodrosophila lebanonensis]